MKIISSLHFLIKTLSRLNSWFELKSTKYIRLNKIKLPWVGMMIKECFILEKQILFHGATLWNNLKKVQKHLSRCLSITHTPEYSYGAEVITRGSYYYQQSLKYIRRWLWKGTITKFIIIIRNSSSLRSEDLKKGRKWKTKKQ